MLSVHRDSHGAQVLLTARNIVAITNDDDGILVHWRCPCGQRGSLRTGLARSTAA